MVDAQRLHSLLGEANGEAIDLAKKHFKDAKTSLYVIEAVLKKLMADAQQQPMNWTLAGELGYFAQQLKQLSERR